MCVRPSSRATPRSEIFKPRLAFCSTIDFRNLYATALERWWGVPAASALGDRYAPLDVLRA
jgi:uncharacterized protein (DUF1501 family)